MIDHDDQVELNELINACCPELSSQRYTSFYTYSDWDTNAGYQGRLEIGSYIFESSGLQNSKEKANEASTSFAKEFFRAMLDSQMSINDSTTVESPKINITATGTSTVKSSLQILQEYVHARQLNLEWDLLLDDRKLGYKFKLKLGDKIFESDIHSRKQLAKQQCSTV
ncbi:hypothetical protein HDV02_003699 [Globomyces sp. JEL0801]|nr:hypothetical protein HDV02_003699 [Globomyces sp. JEL0801]